MFNKLDSDEISYKKELIIPNPTSNLTNLDDTRD